MLTEQTLQIAELIPKPIARFCARLNHDQRKLIWKLNDDYVDLDHFMKGLKEADESLFEKLNPTYLDYCKKVEALPLEAQMFTYRSSIRFLMDIIRIEGQVPNEKQLKAYSWLLANRFSKLEDDSKKALREAFPEYFKVLEGKPTLFFCVFIYF